MAHPAYDTDVSFSMLEDWINGDYHRVLSTLEETEAPLSRVYTAEFTELLGANYPQDVPVFVALLLDASDD